MSRNQMMKLLVVLAMLMSVAGGPAVASTGGEGPRAAKSVCQKACCCDMPCCMAGEKLPARENPAPVQQRVGQDLAATVMAAPFHILFSIGDAEARRAPRALFAAGHAPAPLAASGVWLI